MFTVRTGIIGLAQVIEIDMSTLLLAETDAKMIVSLTVKHYFEYIFMAVLCKVSEHRFMG